MVGWVPVNASLVAIASLPQEGLYMHSSLPVMTDWCEQGNPEISGRPRAATFDAPCQTGETPSQLESPRRRRDVRAQGSRTQAVVTPRRPRGNSDPMVRASDRAELAHKKAVLRKERLEDGVPSSRRLEAGSDDWKNLLQAVQGRVQVLSFDASGCTLVQDVLASSPEDISTALAEELRGHIRAAIDSPHASLVVQKVIDVLPMAQARFVIDEIAGAGIEIARHRNGCRILSRAFERYSVQDSVGVVCGADVAAGCVVETRNSSVMALMDEVLCEATALGRHPLGHFVIEAILQHGTCEHRAKVAGSLHGCLAKSAKNRCASHIVERALQLCDSADRDAMVAELLSNRSDLLFLAQCRFGRYVVKRLAFLDDERGQEVRSLLKVASKDLRTNKYGARLFDDMEQM